MNQILMLIYVYSCFYGLDPALVESIMEVESSYNIQAVSDKGAIGLMQLMPESVHLSKEKLFDPETNIWLGTRYLAYMKEACPFKENYQWVVCYNLGVPRASKMKHPELWPYYRKFIKLYKEKQWRSKSCPIN